MDRVTAIVSVVVALGAILAFVIYWNRRLRAGRPIDDPLEEHFEGRMPIGQLGQRARANASREFLRGPTFFSLAASAFQYATDVKRAKREKRAKEDAESISSPTAAAPTCWRRLFSS